MTKTDATRATNGEKNRRKVLGEDHPDVATSLNNVGGTYFALGEYRKE